MYKNKVVDTKREYCQKLNKNPTLPSDPRTYTATTECEGES